MALVKTSTDSLLALNSFALILALKLLLKRNNKLILTKKLLFKTNLRKETFNFSDKNNIKENTKIYHKPAQQRTIP